MYFIRLALPCIGLIATMATLPAAAQEAVSCRAAIDRAGRAEAPALSADATPELTAGRAARLALAPETATDASGFGGLARFAVQQAGRYRVYSGSAAWVDVLAGDRAIEATSHSHDAECGGVRKMLDYQLEAGAYALKVVGSPTKGMTVLLLRLP